MDKKVLKEILNIDSPSGNEFKLGKHIKKHLENYPIETSYDNFGSLIHKVGDGPFKIMMMAHMDEVSLMVCGVNADKTLKVLKNGGINCSQYLNSRVKIILDDDKYIYGVVYSSKKEPKDADLKIDIGSKDEKLLNSLIGKYAVIDTDYQDLLDHYFTARALDDRLGVYIINEVIKEVSTCIKFDFNKTIYSVNSVGEERTCRGANSSTSIIKPDLAIVVDVTYASDYDDAPTSCDISLNKGGVICYSQTVNNKLNEIMIDICEKYNIPYQKEVWPGNTCTDGDVVYLKENGIPLLLVSIPIRYMHSPSEVANENDVNNIIKMLFNFLSEFDTKTNLKPY